MTGNFSFSDSSNAVCGATSGSGVHSSTKSSISYQSISQSTFSTFSFLLPIHETYLLRQLHEIPILSTITWTQKIPHEKNNKYELNRAADRIVLVAALDVPDEHGRAGDLLEAARNLIYRPDHELLRVLELHVVERAVEDGH